MHITEIWYWVNQFISVKFDADYLRLDNLLNIIDISRTTRAVGHNNAWISIFQAAKNYKLNALIKKEWKGKGCHCKRVGAGRWGRPQSEHNLISHEKQSFQQSCISETSPSMTLEKIIAFRV